MPAEFVDLELPFKGLHQGSGDDSIPIGFTTGKYQNMRPRDWRAGGKRRMATRPGIRRLIEGRVAGDKSVDGLASINTRLDISESMQGKLLFSDEFNRAGTAAGVLGDFDGDASNDWIVAVGTQAFMTPGRLTPGTMQYNALHTVGAAARIDGANNNVEDLRADPAGTIHTISYCYCKPTTIVEPTDNFSITVKFQGRAQLPLTITENSTVGFMCFGDPSKAASGLIDNAFLIGITVVNGGSTTDSTNPDSRRMVPFIAFNSNVSGSSDSILLVADFAFPDGFPQFPRVDKFGPFYDRSQPFWLHRVPKIQSFVTYTMELRVNGVRVELLVDNKMVFVITDASKRKDIGSTVLVPSQSAFGFFISNFNPASAVSLMTKLDSFQCRESSASPAGEFTKIVAASGGNIAVGSETDALLVGLGGAGAVVPAQEITIVPGPGVSADSSNGIRFAYILDGKSYKKVNVLTGSVTAWTASAGFLPESATIPSHKARFAISWDGSLVWYGITSAPDVFGATRVFNWNDFNTTPSFALLNGDEAFESQTANPISCIFPAGDTALGIASLNSIDILTARIGRGGQMIGLTTATGVIGPRSFAVDQSGAIHIIHTSGHWVVPRGGGEPQKISRGRMDKFFREIDPSRFSVVCQWSNSEDGLRIFVTDRSNSRAETKHMFWDRQEDHYCPDTLPSNMNPRATGISTGLDGRERVIFGSSDGYIRVFDSASILDDGSDIDAILQLTPISTGGFDRVILGGLELRMGDAEDKATVELVRGNTTKEIETNIPSVTRVIGPDRIVSRINARVGGAAVGISIKGTRFSIERARALLESGGVIYA